MSEENKIPEENSNPESAIEKTTEKVEIPVTDVKEEITPVTEVIEELVPAATKSDEEATSEGATEDAEEAVTTGESLDSDEVEEIEEAQEENEDEDEVAIEEVDYSTLNQEQLVSHLGALIKNHSFKKIKNQVEAIKTEFNDQFNAETNQVKETFLAEGGNIIDFYHTSSLKKNLDLYMALTEKNKKHITLH